jgi:hypothetical protein
VSTILRTCALAAAVLGWASCGKPDAEAQPPAAPDLPPPAVADADATAPDASLAPASDRPTPGVAADATPRDLAAAARDTTAPPVPAGDAGAPAGSPRLTIELMVATDTSVTARYGAGLDQFLRDVMTHVNYMYRTLSPVLAINVVLARHEKDVDTRGLVMSGTKETLLANFLQWANARNVPSDADPMHFDTKVLLTHADFGMTGWGSIGPVMCKPGSGALVHEEGYKSAKIMAHELGHILGLSHDTDDRTSVMYPVPGTRWSATSTRVLLGALPGESGCLLDCVAPPVYAHVPAFTVEQQCQTRFGQPACGLAGAVNQCGRLYCGTSSRCVYDEGPVLDGSACGAGKWCIGGACVDPSATDIGGFTSCAP